MAEADRMQTAEAAGGLTGVDSDIDGDLDQEGSVIP